jgi:multidrug efflux pump subunit AcrA (membrane-fusion protein)
MGAFASSAALSALQLGMQVVQRKSAQDAAEADAKSQSAQIRQSQAIVQREQLDRLRRAIAAQRARFGAQGVGQGGSSAAVISGLISDVEAERKDYDRLTKLRLNRLDDQLEWGARRNLLQATYPVVRSGVSVASSLGGVSLLDEQ